ncbi:MAG: SagB family peptide dehydrogenase [Roseiflexaceae bacterium]
MPDAPARGELAGRFVAIGQTQFTIDRSTAPALRWKLYRGGQRITLDPHQPVTPGRADLGLAGRLLAESYGLTRQRWRAAPGGPKVEGLVQPLLGPDTSALARDLLRPTPSGGGRFPCELYLAVQGVAGLPDGLYHYDAAHHALDLLRPGDAQGRVQAALARPAQPAPALTLLLGVCFWKSLAAYGSFSYRLHSLDTGILAAQCLETARRYRLEATLHYRFLDGELADLLDLAAEHEGVYAAITLEGAQPGEAAPQPEAAPLPRQHNGGPSLSDVPLLAELHRAVLADAPAAHKHRDLAPAEPPAGTDSIALPTAAALELWRGAARRRSAVGWRRGAPLPPEQLGQILAAAAQGYRNDTLAGDQIRHTLLYCAIGNVAGIAPGVYRYDPARHALAQIRSGDQGAALQATLRGQSYNMHGLHLCLAPVAHYGAGLRAYGDRWYRIQNIEAGLCLQRAGLAASLLGLGSHTNLGYLVPPMDALLQLPEGWTCLAQLLIGTSQPNGQTYEQTLDPRGAHHE